MSSSTVAPSQQGTTGTGFSRRMALKTGAVGSTLLWTAPAIQMIGVSAANADDPSPGGGGNPPPPLTCLPSNGVLIAQCGEDFFGIKIDEDGLDKPGKPVRDALAAAYSGIQFEGATIDGQAVTSGVHPQNAGYFIIVPEGCTIVEATSYDGNIDGNSSGSGQEATPATISPDGMTATFTKTNCDD